MNYQVATHKGTEQRYSFDPWGRRRNATTWSYDNTPSEFLFDRGFTGHEHLDAFGLINMNGRVYDPVLARFLSPDPVVQAPGYGQSYNRYSYCLNNPLAYTDPSGYKVHWYDEDGNPYINTYGNIFGVGYTSGNPGSGNHWSDMDRGLFGNFMLMSSNVFQSYYSISSFNYINNIIPNYQKLPWTSTIPYTKSGQQGFWIDYVRQTSKPKWFGLRSKLNDIGEWECGSAFITCISPYGGGNEKSEPWLTVNFNRGIPQIETNFTDKDWGAITPGPFIIYPKDGSKNKYYNTHEPGHIIQFLILGPVAYYGLVAIPSLITSTTPYHSDMPWEKSAYNVTLF